MRKVSGRLALALVASALSTGPVFAQGAAAAPAVELKVGDMAPDFTLPATDGKTYSLSGNLKGRWVALAWFPKAFTAG